MPRVTARPARHHTRIQTSLGLDPAIKRPWAYALLDTRSQVLEAGEVQDADGALAVALALKPDIVALDAPLGFPLGQCCLEESCACRPASPDPGRACERSLRLEGIGCFWTTKRTIIKPMVYAATRLRSRLEEAGMAVLEVYPYATRVRLFGFPPRGAPKKSTPEGRATLAALLRERLSPARTGALGPDSTHDTLDAVLASYTGVLHLQGRTDVLGDLREGRIVVPKRSRSRQT